MSTISLPTRALLVGIDHYDVAWIPSLAGAVADAHAVRDFLCAHDMPRSHIQLLATRDQAADGVPRRAAILEGISNFLARAPRGSEVLCYIAAHGRRMKAACVQDPLLRTGAQYWESLVPADTDPSGSNDLLRAELHLLFMRLHSIRGIHVTLVTDTCHAGETLRSGPPGGATATRSLGENCVARALPSLLDGSVTYDEYAAAGQYGSRLPYIAVGACGRAETSVEILLGDGAWRGLFTTAWLEGLARTEGKLSHRELLRLVAVLMRSHARRAGRTSEQTPTVGGAAERFLFAPAPQDRKERFFVVSTVGSERVEVESGYVQGLAEGDVLTQVVDWTTPTPVMAWKVCAADSRRARLLPVPPARSVAMAPGTPLLLEAPARPLSVAFDDATDDVREAWQTNAAAPPCLRAVDPDEPPVYQVSLEATTWVIRQTLAPFGVRRVAVHPHNRFQVGILLNRWAQYDRFVARQPRGEDSLPGVFDSHPSGLRIVEIARLTSSGQAYPLPSVDAMPGAAHTIRVGVRHQSSGRWYFTCYVLDEAELVAAQICGDLELEPGDTKMVMRSFPQWTGTTTALKLIVSLAPLGLEAYPNGSWDTPRGLRSLDTGFTQTRWATTTVTY